MARKKKNDADTPPEEPRVKQAHLPDMEPPSISDIDEAGKEYVQARNKWQRAHQPMMDAQATLHEKLRSHKLKRYEFDFNGTTEVAEIVGSEKVKVSAKKEDD